MIEALLICIALYLVISISFFSYERNKMEDTFYNDMSMITSQRGRALNYFIETQMKFASYISNEEIFYDFCIEPDNQKLLNEVNNTFNEVYDTYSFYENIAIVSFVEENQEIIKADGSKFLAKKDGLVVIADNLLNNSIVGKDFSDKIFVKDIIDGSYSNYVSSVEFSDNSEEPIVMLSVPIKNGNNLIGALLVCIKMDYFSERYIDKFKHGETGHLFILDSRGFVIANSIRESILNDSDKFRETTKKIVDEVINKGESKLDESLFFIEKYYVFSEVNFPNIKLEDHWYVGFVQEKSEIFKDMAKLGIKSIITLFGIGAFLLIYLYMMLIRHSEKVDKNIILQVNEMLEKKVEEKTIELKQLAIIDSLTGVYNRNHIIDILEREIENSKNKTEPLVLMMLDIDWFKKINDTYGHQLGDEVLAKVAETIHIKSGENGILGRYGGEEFLLVVKDTDLNSGINIAEEIRASISNLKIIDNDSNIYVTISIGLCKLKDYTLKEFIHIADQLMYEAKNSGRDCVKSC